MPLTKSRQSLYNSWLVCSVITYHVKNQYKNESIFS